MSTHPPVPYSRVFNVLMWCVVLIIITSAIGGLILLVTGKRSPSRPEVAHATNTATYHCNKARGGLTNIYVIDIGRTFEVTATCGNGEYVRVSGTY